MQKDCPKRYSAQGSMFRVLAGLVVAALFLVPALALAHAEVTASTPADGSNVQAGLTQISVTFSEEISPEQSSAQLVDASGATITGVTSAVDRAERTKMVINTPPLQPGKYTVKWEAVTIDDNGHTNGTLQFTAIETLGAGTASGTASPAAAVSSPTAAPTAVPSSSPGDVPTTGGGGGWVVPTIAVLGALLVLGAGLLLRKRSGPAK